MDSPQNQIWGLNLWIILHSCAERIGTSPIKKLPQEESRLWQGLLASLRYSLPCPQCKKHYTDYFNSSSLPFITKEAVRTWLFNLHCQVNSKIDKPNVLTIDKIPEIYSQPFNFGYHFGIVNEQMIRAVRIGWCNRDDIQRSVRLFTEMKRFYDLF